MNYHFMLKSTDLETCLSEKSPLTHYIFTCAIFCHRYRSLLHLVGGGGMIKKHTVLSATMIFHSHILLVTSSITIHGIYFKSTSSSHPSPAIFILRNITRPPNGHFFCWQISYPSVCIFVMLGQGLANHTTLLSLSTNWDWQKVCTEGFQA